MKSRKKKSSNLIPERNKKGRRISGKTGLPPGTLVHIGKILTESVSVRITEYSTDKINQTVIIDPEGLSFPDDSMNRWLEVNGLQDVRTVESIGKSLHISPLVLEDVVNTEHRPKLDFHDGMLFLTLKAFSLSEQNEIQSEQASFVLGKDFLISFQESNHNWFEPVKILLANSSGKVRHRGLDFLLYSLIDVIVDQYYEVVEFIGDKLDDLEVQIFEKPSQELFENIRLIKKDIITIRKALVPALEAMNRLKRDEPELISESVKKYYDDIHDHIIQILDYVDTYRELGSELKENYLSNITLRMNQVMKLLTIITTIFIPLSFVAGIYGMNFENMPELTWKYGYFIVLGLMFSIMISMLIYFRIKKWM